MPPSYPLRLGGSRGCPCADTPRDPFVVSIYGAIRTQNSTSEASAAGIFLLAHAVPHRSPEPQRQQAEERRSLAGRAALVVVEGAGEAAGLPRRRGLLFPARAPAAPPGPPPPRPLLSPAG